MESNENLIDLNLAQEAVSLLRQIVENGISSLKGLVESSEKSSVNAIDDYQVLAYDLAHSVAGYKLAEHALFGANNGQNDGSLALSFIADVFGDVISRSVGREDFWGINSGLSPTVLTFLKRYRDPAFLASLYEIDVKTNDSEEFELVRETFKRFASDKIRPRAEHVHRNNEDVPEDIIEGLAEIGAFGLSVPEEYGGFALGGEHDYIGMVIATEELSRGSLGIGGSLITRPEILARALIAGGTEEQKNEYLPKLATAEIMNAVAVTEPDYGSDVANISVTATEGDGGWYINGVKTWCTFAARADVLMLLARTDPDKSVTHRGLSLFVVPKERAESHGFVIEKESPNGKSKLEGRPIDTIGYRGMHSYELAFENWWVPDENLVGGKDGLNKGFYFQMKGFENGRLQTAARAVGVMQAALDAAIEYAQNRKVFGSPIGNYQLTQAKIGKMKAIVNASRQFSYEVAKLMGQGKGSMEASLVKAYVCKAAEWVTREAMQIHGGMGYAEEYDVSRYFVDARVLSIFEGADETLCLKVIARSLIQD